MYVEEGGDDHLMVHFFGMIWIRISDPRSLGSRCIKETDESVTRVDSSVPLMHRDLSNPRLLILIQTTPKEHTLSLKLT